MSLPPGYVFAGNYEVEIGVITLVLVVPLAVLFWSNRRLYPLAQREPGLALAAAVAYSILVSEWFIDSHVPELPYIVRKIVSQFAFLFLFAGFWIRAWTLWMDAGLAKERVQNKIGFFIRHRNFRSNKFLLKMKIGFFIFHMLQLLVDCLWGSYTNLMPARIGTLLDPTIYFGVIIILGYWISFIVWSFILLKVKDGFFIKTELRLVGAGCGLTTLTWFCWLLFRLPCSFPNCRVFILWISALWMVIWSVIFPLQKAMKDPRFSYTSWLECKRRYKRADSQASKSENSDNSRSESMDDYGYSEHSRAEPLPAAVRKLSEATATRLRRVNLASFISYSPGREAFRDFLVGEFSVENLLFVEAVQAFEANAQRTKTDCESVFEKFIADSATNQINLPSVMIQRIKARITDVESGDTMRGMFDEANAHIMKLMQRDAFKRFQLTDAWATHVVVFRVEDKKKEKQTEAPSETASQSSPSEASSPAVSSEASSPASSSSESSNSSSSSSVPHLQVQVQVQAEANPSAGVELVAALPGPSAAVPAEASE